MIMDALNTLLTLKKNMKAIMDKTLNMPLCLTLLLSLLSPGFVFAENPSLDPDLRKFVNVLDRNYGEDTVDIEFHILGGDLPLERSYRQKDGWSFYPLIDKLEIAYSSEGGVIQTITRQGLEYTPSGDDFVNGFKRIVLNADGFFHTNEATLRWEQFDTQGVMTEFGLDALALGELSYTANGQLDQIINPQNRVVLADLNYDGSGRIVRAANSAGAFVEYTYNANGSIATFRDVRGNITTYTYDARNRLIQTEHPGEVIRKIAYNDTYGFVKSLLNGDDVGVFYDYAYDNQFNEFYVKLTTSTGRAEERFYNGDRELIRVVVNGVETQRIDYLDDGNRKLITDAAGNVTEEIITENGRTVTQILADGNEMRMVVAPDRDYITLREVDARGFETVYSYDVYNRMTSKTEAAGTAFEKRMNYTYDTRGNLATTTLVGDARTPTCVTTYTYDNYNRLIQVQLPEGNTRAYVYNDYNQTVIERDGKGKETTYTYDPITGKLLTVTTPLGSTVTYTYDSFGRLERIENELGESIRYERLDDRDFQYDPYDAKTTVEFNDQGLPIKITDANGQVIIREYDIHNRVTVSKDGNNNETRYTYDSRFYSFANGNMGEDVIAQVDTPTFQQTAEYDNRLNVFRSVYSFDGQQRAQHVVAFNENGQPLELEDAKGNTIIYTYDPFGRILTRTTGVGGQDKVFTFTYDDRGKLITSIGPDNKTLVYEYDRNGNLIKKTFQDNSVWTYEYDANDYVVTEYDPDNGKTTLSYDDDSRVTSQQFFEDKDATVADVELTFTYDVVNRPLTVSDGSVTVGYTWDKAGRKLSETTNYGNGVSLTHSYSYYANGQVKTLTGPDGIVYSYTYDNAGNLTAVTAPGMGAISWSNYKWTEAQKITYPGGLEKLLSFNGMLEVTGVSFKDQQNTILFDEGYGRDLLGLVASTTSPAGLTQYGYDEEMQLLSVTSTDSGVANEAYSYDLLGNRISDIENTAYDYNNLCGLTQYGSDTFTYDANGNVLTRTSGSGVLYEFEYDARDRMTRIREDDVVVVEYYYDPLGRRAWKEVQGVRTYYHYSDQGLIAEADTAGNITRSYGYAPGNIVCSDPLFQLEQGVYHFFVNDVNSRPRMTVTAAGFVTWEAGYSALGKASIAPSSTLECNMRPSGQYYDAETGFHYNLMRYYNPDTGRYLSPDPFGQTISPNMYLFSFNSPLNFLDPDGRCPVGQCDQLRVNVNYEQKFPLGPQIDLKLKVTVRGQGNVCYKCCDDGSCGKKMQMSGSGIVTGEADYASFKFKLWKLEIKAGLNVKGSIFSEKSGSASIDTCEGGKACVKFQGKTGLGLAVGVTVEVKIPANLGPVKDFSVSAWGGGEVKGWLEDFIEVCANGSVNYGVNKICASGEIYVAAKLKVAFKNSWNIEVEPRWTLWKKSGCL